MKRTLRITAGIASLCMLAGATSAQIAFTNGSSRLTNSVKSTNVLTVADWNNDGLDDIIRLHEGYQLVIDEQRPGQNFLEHNFGTVGSGSGWAWGMAVGDFDGNGYKDVVAGGYSSGTPLRVIMMNSTGTGITIQNLTPGGFFVQNITLGDINNDGHLDIFVCDDNAMSHIFINDGNGAFTHNTTLMNFDVTATDDSGNYGSVWTDYDNDGDLDLYIAKCRQSVSNPADGRRINVLFRNNGNGTFTEAAAPANINVGWQSWSASFGDIDNDNDFDLVLTNHDYAAQLFINNGSGVFTENTTSGINTTGFTPIQSGFEDFDNDGFVDLLITGSSGAKMFRNNGDLTFSQITVPFQAAPAIYTPSWGDLNHDGFIDVFASYGTIYNNPSSTNNDRLYLGTPNGNHFLCVNLTGTISNPDAVGARVTIYGPFGLQTREVRAGESYGNQYSGLIHFGLGSNTQVDSILIDWPTSGVQVIENPTVDNFITVVESNCVSPLTGNITSSNGSFAFCTGQSVTLQAPTGTGYTYLWSNGSTASSINVNTTGEYSVVITQSGNACPAISPSVNVTENPDETPTISANGPTSFCYGESVTLAGPTGMNGYDWSNGEQTSSIVVTQAGTYSLDVTGACATFSSNNIVVDVMTAPSPTTSDVSIPVPGTANLSATGNSVVWYDAAVGGNQVGVGNNWTTPFLNTTTSFFAEDMEIFGGDQYSGGKIYGPTPAAYGGNTTNPKTFFNVTEAGTLESVKVYTDRYGIRRIQVFNNAAQLVAFVDADIQADTVVVPLNIDLTPGTGYYITTDGATNSNIPGNAGNTTPRLMRHASGITFPYNVGPAISITGNDLSVGYYYFFYDWRFKTTEFDCPGPRAEAIVTVVSPVGLNEVTEGGFRIFPNPTRDFLNIESKGNYAIEIIDLTGRAVYSMSNANGNQRIDVNSLIPGVYFVRLNGASGKTIQKIVIQ
ncbi:MAG TPA: hypothetical protein DEP18_01360 [Flavobacteriales bacterium]|nr:hypothetical protein [Flavobacteriales bacterium]HRE74963.1 FG-GAP-like repeat-containing protein [Flavobacteriales bacterium]HRE95415.1 FG-GAP-like repeat-containing protein [Flavobacteriales bacterium]HRJ35987.1 FG-GAP-like repeat-containing protein [Flavobacteriales bacterium]HRJ38075.1 FG-GAP-like repeat-containing protein [Flavobacteriales bacterium]